MLNNHSMRQRKGFEVDKVVYKKMDWEDCTGLGDITSLHDSYIYMNHFFLMGHSFSC